MRSYKDIFGVQIIPLIQNNTIADPEIDNNRVFENNESGQTSNDLINFEGKCQNYEFKDDTDNVKKGDVEISNGDNCENGQQPEIASYSNNNGIVDNLDRSFAGISVNENSSDDSVRAYDIPHPNPQSHREEKVELITLIYCFIALT